MKKIVDLRRDTITLPTFEIFLPSGTMDNLVALLTHTQRGNEIILEEIAHIFYFRNRWVSSGGRFDGQNFAG